MSVTLVIRSSNGEVNLTQYLNVQKGEGMDPSDPSFTSKVFAHSLLKQGATYALEDMKLKELTFPLILRASTKASLTKLIQEINTVLNTPGAQVEWKDEGATEATFFDLGSGQLDPEFDYRLSEHNGIRCHARLFVQPLGYKSKAGARAATVGGAGTVTAVGTTPIITFAMNGTLAGDAPALLQAQIRQEAALAYSAKPFLAFSVLPSGSYIPFIRSPSLVASGASNVFASATTTPGATYIHLASAGSNNALFEWAQPGESRFAYVGEQRILAIARTPTGALAQPIYSRPYERQHSAVGNTRRESERLGRATPVATAMWQLLDLGVVALASSSLAAGAPAGVGIWSASPAGGSAQIDVAGLILLPETSTSFANLEGYEPNAGAPEGLAIFDGIANAIRVGGSMGVPAEAIPAAAGAGFADVTRFVRGQVPQAVPEPTPPTFAALMFPPLQPFGAPYAAEPLYVNVNVLERTRYVF